MIHFTTEPKVISHIDHEIHSCACPACKGEAKRERWDEVEVLTAGLSEITTHTRVNCDCGYAWSSDGGTLCDPRFDGDLEAA